MNYYHCYGFSEVHDVECEVDILIAHTDINHARMVASRYITNISHFDIYPINIKEFGSCEYNINHEGEIITIISSLPTIKEGFKLLSDIGMDITSVNSLLHPLKPNLQRIIWGMLRKEFGISNDDPFTIETEEDESESGELTPTQLIKITELITHILQDAKELYVKIKGVILGDNVILFTKNIEILQQTLSQGNIILAKEQTKKLIQLMEQVESEYIEYEKARDHQIQSQITIPNLNTILAHNQWVTAHKLYELQSAENHKVEQRYMTIYHKVFQKAVLYIKGIWSEIAATVGPHSSIASYFVRKFEYMLIFMSFMIVIILENNGHTRYRGSVLYVVGILGFALQCSHLIHTKRLYLKLGIITASMLVIGSLGYLLASNLALI